MATTIENRSNDAQNLSRFSRSRRNLLAAGPALVFLPWGCASEGGAGSVAVQKLHSFRLRVRDVGRSVAFYQDLFGAAVQARQGSDVTLRVGDGPHHFTISEAAADEAPSIAHIGLSVADFDVDAVQAQLRGFGVAPGPGPASTSDRLAVGMTSWVRERAGGTRDLYFADIEGLIYHLSSPTDCGGDGVLGEVCNAVEAAPSAGMFALVDYNHFTNFTANRSRANDFHRRVFGKEFQAYQGPNAPVIGVGDGFQFLMYTGAEEAGPPQNPALIHHVCFSMTGFDVDNILARLTGYGLRARPDGAATEPLMHWVSMRMPNRGGFETGTPEVYFSDPDGISIQLQDSTYCGGGGYLGDECAPLG